MIALLLLASPLSAPSVEVDAVEVLREPWRAACESVARDLPGEGGTWSVRVRQAASIEEFTARTGRARFEAAALAGDTIWIQPASLLNRFGDLDPIRRHECVHARLRHLGIPPLPHLVEEAIALGIAGQASRLPPSPPLARAQIPAAEQSLAQPADRTRFEAALAQAYATIWPKWKERSAGARMAWLRRIVFAGSAWVDLL